MKIMKNNIYFSLKIIGIIQNNGTNLKLAKIHHALFLESSPGPVKFAAELLNLCSSETRLPLVPIKESTKSLVIECMSEIGLI